MGTVTVQGRDELGRLIDVTLTTAADVEPPGPEVVSGGSGGVTVDNGTDPPAEVTSLVSSGAVVAGSEATLAPPITIEGTTTIIDVEQGEFQVRADDGSSGTNTKLTVSGIHFDVDLLAAEFHDFRVRSDLSAVLTIGANGTGDIIMNLPTVNPNVAGQLWNDNGTLKVSAG